MSDNDEELKKLIAAKMQRIMSTPRGVFAVDESTFREKVLSAKIPVLVDLWAPWCGPCKAIAPILEQLEIEYRNKILFAKLNVDENQGIAQKYQASSIPSLIVFYEGKVLTRTVGAQPKAKLKILLDKVIEHIS